MVRWKEIVAMRKWFALDYSETTMGSARISCSDKKTKNKNRKDADEVVWANVEKRVCRKKKKNRWGGWWWYGVCVVVEGGKNKPLPKGKQAQ